MIQLRGVEDKEVVEMAPDTKCYLIDGLHYTETKEVKRIGALTTLQELRTFEMVEVYTGFDDDEQPRVMAILPRRKNGVASLLAAMVLGLGVFGCSGATYSYSYSCYGQGCVPPTVQVGVMYQRSMPYQARVMYVNRPMEIQVLRDGTTQRRAAMPRRSFK